MPERVTRKAGLAGLVLLVLASCATVPPSQQDDRVIELIDRYNTLPAAEVVELATVPFLFGDQILYSQADLEAVIGRLQDGGLVIAPVITGSTTDVVVQADARFDVGVFYDRLPEDARLVVADSNAGPVSLIVGGERDGLPLLYGLMRGRP